MRCKADTSMRFVVAMLKTEYRVRDVIDYSGLEPDNAFLEGTAAMVLDHLARVAYTTRSNRVGAVALERFCRHFNFEPMAFDTTDAADAARQPDYHTNVLMCVATEFALVGLGLVADALRRAQLRARLGETGREVIDLDARQIGEFGGNALELSGDAGRVLAMSARAVQSLTPDQRRVIERSAQIVGRDAAFAHLSISVIAMEHGVNDLSHFSPTFRVKYGLSPRAFRAPELSRCITAPTKAAHPPLGA